MEGSERMKIIHCCFGNEHYIDTWGYQQNILPLYHGKLGHDTIVLASNDTYPTFVNKDIIDEIKKKGDCYENGPVKVKRCPSYFAKHIHFQKAKGLKAILEREQPDIIFFHGCLNFSILSCVSYKKKHRTTKLYADNHGDIFNVNPSKAYRFFFFKCFWSAIHKYCQRYVDCYYGVTNGRCDFLKEYFHIKAKRVKLLPIGADVDAAKAITESKEILREKYGFLPSDMIIVHGGKLDPRKGTVDLIEVYRQLRQQGYNNLRLVLFGKMVDQRIKPMLDKDIVVYDWLSRTGTFELFKMADLAVWPIHHTTLIEDCVASKLPYLIRKTDTTKHLINSDFYLETGDKEELTIKIEQFLQNADKNSYIKHTLKMQEIISYYSIAKKVTE